ncbi:MAG: TrmH family RNA methyltransferase [Bacillota bacterium]
MVEVITSKRNSHIKRLRKLYRARKRRKEEKFILEGSRIIEQAYQAGASFSELFLTPEFESDRLEDLLKNKSYDLKYVSPRILKEVTDTVSPQGVVAVVDKPHYEPEDIFQGQNNFVLTLDRIQDPGNMGTLIRTAAAVGVDGLIALKGCVDIYNLKVLRATMGALFSVPVLTRISREEFLDMFSSVPYDLVCTDAAGNDFYYEPEYEQPVNFVIGNEAQGISPELLARANYRVKIPLVGKMESLNAAVSGGIVLYDFLRKKRAAKNTAEKSS